MRAFPDYSCIPGLVKKKSHTFLSLLTLAAALQTHALTVDFEGFNLPEDTFNNGPVPEGDVTETENPFGPDSGLLITTEGAWVDSTGIELANSFNRLENPPGTLSYTYWSGIGLSNTVDTTTPGLANESSSYAGGGAGFSGAVFPGAPYGIFFAGRDAVFFPEGVAPQGLYVTNNTYAALAMRDGDAFSKKFEQGDWFQLTITGMDAEGETSGEAIFFLADFRSSNTDNHYILDEWAWVDLRHFHHTTRRLEFSFYSSDVGEFGINTPEYVAVDNITGTAAALHDSQPISKGGWNGSQWFGEYYDEQLPWIYQEDLGWLYLDNTSTAEDFVFYSDLVGWASTNRALFPWLYAYETDTWLYYIKDTAEPWLFYDATTGEVLEVSSSSDLVRD